ncbi:dipeptide ABC transporter ATP-binding protein [Seohaeicola saemankumensis]|uniref:ABC transporter ATP-binding protein n=1 Tax=Seohaeicola saemankumensis TaxID=481181 RepID=UPI001E46FB6C|nr:dipeptide ABC transporter ATP-binding protein [Seohaeicola saemankumensis]MCD1627343.1 dipeptide ABC transporter ATP-binding protein [Seohaeicola saemankumensis]
MTDIILETRDLHKRFVQGGGLFAKTTTIHAVNGVSLQVRRGETFAIVGESGCGKSTLARLLLRLIDASEGRVSYEGQDLTGLSGAQMRALRSDLQFIFQDPFSSLNPRMSVEAIIGEPLRLHTALGASARRARVAELMARVGLRPDMADRYPHEFSGGQRQRICIARALASAPKLLIGDEPVSALDVSVQAQIVNLLEDLKQEFGLTLVIIAHDLAVIRHMSDRIAVMYLGEVVELADTETLFTAPRHPYTQALLAAIPVPVPGAAQARTVLGGDIPSPANPPSGCKFHTRCPHATDLCRSTRPVLDGTVHQVACHHHQTLPPPDLPIARTGTRSLAAEARFALYRAATNEKPNNKETTT